MYFIVQFIEIQKKKKPQQEKRVCSKIIFLYFYQKYLRLNFHWIQLKEHQCFFFDIPSEWDKNMEQHR